MLKLEFEFEIGYGPNPEEHWFTQLRESSERMKFFSVHSMQSAYQGLKFM